MKQFLTLIFFLITTLSFGQREIKDKRLILGNGTDADVSIEVNLGLPGSPKQRYNVTTDVWEFSHDGTVWQTMVGLGYTDVQLALKAPLASPSLTGVPVAPTAAPGTNTTQLATTAFVAAESATAVHVTGNESVAGVKTFTGKLLASSTTNGAHPCPTMSDAQMLAIASPVDGDCVMNSTLNSWLVYNATDLIWEEVGGGGGISNWLTATIYDIGDVVIQSNKIYQVNTAHTSGVFATDLAKWTQIANNVSDSTGTLPIANGGTNSTTALSGSSIVVSNGTSIVQGAAGTSSTVLHGNASGAPVYAAVSLTNDVSNVLPVASGGTNASNPLSGSSVMVSNGTSVIQGAAGTSTTLLHGNASGVPTYSAASLTADVSGILPIANGGTNSNTALSGSSIAISNGTSIVQGAAGTTATVLHGNASGAPTYGAVSLTNDTSGVLTLAKGGSEKGLTAAAGGVVYTDADSMEVSAAGATGEFLKSNGSSAPAFAKGNITAKGQAASAVTMEQLQVPNSQLTLTAAGKYLLDDCGVPGNLLSNCGFEHSTYDNSWSLTGGAGSAAESTIKMGGQGMVIAATADVISLKQTSTTNAASYAYGGVQGLGMMRVNSPVAGLYLCPVLAGVSVSSDYASRCYTYRGDSTWELGKIPFTLGGTSNGVELLSAVALTGNIYVDDAVTAAVDLKQDVGVLGAWTTGTCTTSWIANTTIVCKYRQVGEDVEVQYQLTTSGAPTAGALTVNLPNSWVVDASKFATGTSSASSGKTCFINDSAGTAFYECQTLMNGGSGVIAVLAEGTASTYANNNASVNNTIPITFGATDYVAFTVKVPVTAFSGASSIYNSRNADTGWTDFTPTGLWVANTTYTGKYKRKGSMAEIQISWTTSGVPTTSGLAITIPSGLTIDTSKLVKGTSVANYSSSCIINDSGASFFDCSTLYYSPTEVVIEAKLANSTYVTQQSTVSPTIPHTWGAADYGTTTFSVPIVGWDDSNIIIGQFNGLESCASTLACTDRFGANIDAGDGVSGENVDWINGACTNAGTGLQTCTFNSGIFTQTPVCVVSAGPIGGSYQYANILSISSSAVTIEVRRTDSNITINNATTIHCDKAGSDYIGKTAKAVSSDQNDKTPGVIGERTCKYAFGGAAATLAAPVVCSTGTCVEVEDNCATGTPPAFVTTGKYTNLTFAAGTFANSTLLDCRCSAFDTAAGPTEVCTTYFDTSDQTWASNSSGGAVLNLYSTVASGTVANSHMVVTCKGKGP